MVRALPVEAASWVGLLRVASAAVCNVSREPWIVLVAEVAQRLPKIDPPPMFVLYQRSESFGTLSEERTADLGHQPACNSPSSVFGRHREAIDVTAPSVPSTDH